MLADVERVISQRPAGTRLLLLSDYDGTLADFDPDPTIPRPNPRTAELLSKLASRTDLSFGIVSGRRVADLRTRTQLPSRVYLAGLHGMEIEVGSRRWQHPDLDDARQYVRDLYERLDEVHDVVPGLVLEDKHASVAIHVRAVAPELRAAAIERADRCAEEWLANGKLRRLTGSHVVEYLPNIAAHKGDATRWIVEDVEERCKQPAWTLFIGDDVTDEDAFKAVRRGIGVLVGARETHATHRIAGTRDVEALLEWLATSAVQSAV
ncbi:MAG TPA: trehalose-phosphatase [Vicinamibacterales bacterium]|nr:trehalose-phosphatase [Vicinamibacterales bacterium]